MFKVNLHRYGCPEEKFRDAEDETKTFNCLSDMLTFLIHLDGQHWDSVEVFEIIERKIL